MGKNSSTVDPGCIGAQSYVGLCGFVLFERALRTTVWSSKVIPGDMRFRETIPRCCRSAGSEKRGDGSQFLRQCRQQVAGSDREEGSAQALETGGVKKKRVRRHTLAG